MAIIFVRLDDDTGQVADVERKPGLITQIRDANSLKDVGEIIGPRLPVPRLPAPFFQQDYFDIIDQSTLLSDAQKAQLKDRIKDLGPFDVVEVVGGGKVQPVEQPAEQVQVGQVKDAPPPLKPVVILFLDP